MSEYNSVFLDRLCLLVAFDTQSIRALLSIIFTFSKLLVPVCYKASDFHKQMFVAACPNIHILLAIPYFLKIVLSDLFLYCLWLLLNSPVLE